MSNVANKCFSPGPNQFKSSQDRTNQKKAQTLYTTTATNTKSNTKDNTPICLSSDRCLASVGGYNTNNYELLLDLTKGRYYAAEKLLAKVDIVDCSQNISHCISVDISSTFIKPDYTYNMYEGPFMYNDISSANSHCLPTTLNKQLSIDPSAATICNYPFAKLVSEEKLRNFDFPFKFRIPNKKY